MSTIEHKDLTSIHPFSHISSVDPGPVGAGKGWIDTSVTPARLKYRNSLNDGWLDLATGAVPITPIGIACSDESTPLVVAPAVVTFRMPFGYNLNSVRMSLTTAQASGTIFTVNIKQNGTSILSTLLTIDNTEKTSTTAATPAVISTSVLTDDAEIVIAITQIGNGTATGLKVFLIGSKI